MANSVVVDGEFLLEWCGHFGQAQVWYISYVPQLPVVLSCVVLLAPLISEM